MSTYFEGSGRVETIWEPPRTAGRNNILTNKRLGVGTEIALRFAQTASSALLRMLQPDGKRERTVTLNRDIYPNLKLRMYTTGIRQNRVAKMLGIHEASLSRIMNGFREPSHEIRMHLAEILQSDPDWLFYKMQTNDEVFFVGNHLAVHQ